MVHFNNFFHREPIPIFLVLICSRQKVDQEIPDTLEDDGGLISMAMEKWMKGQIIQATHGEYLEKDARIHLL